MAENQNENQNSNNNDENDPYKFFKFPGPENNDDKNKNKKNNGKKKLPFWPILLLTLFVVAMAEVFLFPKNDDLIDYSDFKEKIERGEIKSVVISDSYFIGYGNVIETKAEGKGLKLFNAPSVKSAVQYKTSAVLTQSFLDFLEENNIHYKFAAKQNNWFLQLLLNLVVPFGLIFLLYFFLFRKMGGGSGGMGSIFSVGNSRAKVVEEGKIKTRFTDVAGVDEAKEELVEVVDFLKSPKKYTDIGGKIPKGVLLVGDPGTGKTLLARAVAGEAGVPFFSISGSDFVEMFVGVGASRVRDLFKQAREKAPCIVFIDEIDALAKSRANGFSSNDEREQTLNQLLVEMDGFDNEKGLIVLAATNRVDVLDPAILRPGRFDRQVPVEKPDVKGREEILRIHAKNVKLDKDVDFESVAHGTTGFAGADLANVVNEAALLAVRNGRKKVTMEDFNDAIDKVSIGLKKKSRKDNKKQMRLVSVHETGHALVAAFNPDHEPVNKITVVPRSHGVGGFTQYREEGEEKFNMTRKDMMDEIDSLLGGRAAEEVILGDISTGASNDIARATDIIKRMITDFGMSDKFKNMTLGKGVLGTRGGDANLIREFSEQSQNYIDEEIARIMNERYNYVVKLLKQHKDLLEYIANRLVEIETMDGKEFYEIVKGEAHCKELTENAGKKEKTSETSKESSTAKKPRAPRKTKKEE
ncbi:ATP-dependent zinc metalloprotease FtsH [Treponema bryantii]|uniref:ATP-dependent zinc metalloprotease FtsH n=1 Tax=Treponema bryantii TaxID=163 RepID=UPI002B2A47B2|nr:ATP-dependent zinc metalloprotease FtsH [Treponema bryantii]